MSVRRPARTCVLPVPRGPDPPRLAAQTDHGKGGTSYIMPDNAFIESFNGKLRAECLNAHWFLSLDDAVRKCEDWRVDYNEVRPHSAIGNKVPISLTNRLVAHGPPQLTDAG